MDVWTVWFNDIYLIQQLTSFSPGTPFPPTLNPPPHPPFLPVELVTTAVKVIWGCKKQERQRACYKNSFNFYFLSPKTSFFYLFFIYSTREGAYPYHLIFFCCGGGPGTVHPERKVLAQRKRWRKLEDESEAKSMSMSPWAESNKLH